MRDVAANGSLAQPLQLINLFHLILFHQFPFLSNNVSPIPFFIRGCLSNSLVDLILFEQFFLIWHYLTGN